MGRYVCILSQLSGFLLGSTRYSSFFCLLAFLMRSRVTPWYVVNLFNLPTTLIDQFAKYSLVLLCLAAVCDHRTQQTFYLFFTSISPLLLVGWRIRTDTGCTAAAAAAAAAVMALGIIERTVQCEDTKLLCWAPTAVAQFLLTPQPLQRRNLLSIANHCIFWHYY